MVIDGASALSTLCPAGIPETKVPLHVSVTPVADGNEPHPTAEIFEFCVTAVAATPEGSVSRIENEVPEILPPVFPSFNS